MKIGITGHTKGIGKSLYDLLTQDNQVIGYTRSTGFDIGDPTVRDRIVSECKDCDIFINNAYHPEGQQILLEQFIAQWTGTDKIIINIGSKIHFKPYVLGKYSQSKFQMQRIINQRMWQDLSPRIMNLSLDVVDTEMTINYNADFKLAPDAVASFIVTMLQYKDTIWVEDMVVRDPRRKTNDNLLN